MQIEVKVPSVGESVQEAVIAEWFKEDGEKVKKDEPLFVIETDKVTLEVEAEADGTLSIKVAEGETVSIGQVVAVIDTEGAEAADKKAEAKEKERPEPEEEKAEEEKKEAPPEKEKAPSAEAAERKAKEPEPKAAAAPGSEEVERLLSPAVRRLLEEHDLDPAEISGTGPGGRITKGDVLLHLEGAEPGRGDKRPSRETEEKPSEEDGGVRRKKMSPIRQRIAARLLEAKQNTAMLTTFNEIDMSRAMEIRSSYKAAFEKRHGIALGFMSFFIRASVEALKEFPAVNAYIEGQEIVYHDYCNIGIAIGSERGLVVPVIRNAQKKSFAELEQAIVDFVEKIKKNRLELSDLEEGTFTITNGGVFGSLLSTPILNTPQSGILGMHKIEKRPVVVEDEVVVRPMMYVALSYDHRIIDGREAVTFLRRIKEFVENPERMMLEI